MNLFHCDYSRSTKQNDLAQNSTHYLKEGWYTEPHLGSIQQD